MLVWLTISLGRPFEHKVKRSAQSGLVDNGTVDVPDLRQGRSEQSAGHVSRADALAAWRM
jgi:hypothetical protein